MPAQNDKELGYPVEKQCVEIGSDERERLKDAIGAGALVKLEEERVRLFSFEDHRRHVIGLLEDRIIDIAFLRHKKELGETAAVELSFMYAKDFNPRVKKIREILKNDEKSLRQGKNLDGGSLRFLRFVADFVLKIKPDCKILFDPVDEQRGRIYTKWLTRKNGGDLPTNIEFVRYGPKDRTILNDLIVD